MRTAVCFYSRHHGNTRKVLEALGDLDLIDVTAPGDVRLEDYDRIGFASGVYYGKYHSSLTAFAQARLPQGKDVFFLCTCGSRWKGASKALRETAAAKGCRVLGEFGCRGYDTYGPFKLIGGIAKGHPSPADLDQARAFYRDLGGGK